MKKFTRLLKSLSWMVVTLFAVSSCVDKDFDLSEIDSKNITVGANYVAPLGNVSLDVTEYMTDDSESSGGSDKVTLDPINEEFPIDEGFDEEIIKNLIGAGDITIMAKINNILPVPLEISASFVEQSNANVYILNKKIIESIGNETIIESNVITEEMLRKIARSKSIRISIKVKDGVSNKFTFDQSILKTLNIKLIIKKTGGIKF